MEKDEAGRSGRWQRRERRQNSVRGRMKKHGVTLRRLYVDSIRKRLLARKPT